MNTITLKFPFRVSSNGNGMFSYLDDSRISVSTHAYGGPKIRKALKEGLQRHVDVALDTVANSQKRLIVTREGPVLVLRRESGGWGYDICTATRDFAGSNLGGWKTFDELLADARKHAESSYGGILWECSL